MTVTATSVGEAVRKHEVLQEALDPPNRREYPNSSHVRRPERWHHYQLRGDDYAKARQVLAEHNFVLDNMAKHPGPLRPAPPTSLLETPTADNIPDPPALDKVHPSHGIVFFGPEQSGKTCLVRSVAAAVTGAYPRSSEAKVSGVDTFYELPDQASLDLFEGLKKEIPVVLTDTPGLESGAMAASLTAKCQTHRAVVLVVNGFTPIWDDPGYFARFLSLLLAFRAKRWNVAVAITRLNELRNSCLEPFLRGNEPAMHPRSSYEEFSTRYLSKFCHFLGTSHPALARYAIANATIFDAPAWPTRRDFLTAHEGSPEAIPRSFQATTHKPRGLQPSNVYIRSQLRRLLEATQVDAFAQDGFHGGCLAIPPIYKVEEHLGFHNHQRPWSKVSEKPGTGNLLDQCFHHFRH